MNTRIAVCVLVTALSPLAVVNAGVIYDGGSPNRPTSVTGLVLANGTFDATFDYSTSFGDAIIDYSLVTGSSDVDITTALLAQLNRTGIDSTQTNIFISITDAEPFNLPDRFHGVSVVSNTSSNNWRSSFAGTFHDSNTTDPVLGVINAIATFTPTGVPEPSTALLLCLASLTGFGTCRL